MRLPWTYWPIMAVAIVMYALLGGVIGAAIGVNPYIGAAVSSGLLVLHEVYTLARASTESHEKGGRP